MKKYDIDTMHTCLAYALHNLLVRNNIEPKDFLMTMQEVRNKKLYIQNPPSETIKGDKQ